jgi:chromosome condensin MukBEF ATPase and DNA-binding subunit MukB
MMSTQSRCGYTLVDNDGEQYPCDRPATGWRWYQDVEHEDALDEACELHSNEGGRRIHDAETELDRLRAEIADRDAEAADISRSMGVSMEQAAAAWRRATGRDSLVNLADLPGWEA